MAKKRELPDQQMDYIIRIKGQLHKAFGASKLSLTQLQEILEENYGFNINKGTLANLFDVNNMNMDYACLVTVCKFFGFDFKEFLEPDLMVNGQELFTNNAKIAERLTAEEKRKAEIIDHPFLASIEPVKKKFMVLRDEGYMGEFEGFIMSPTTNGDMSKFSLSIQQSDEGYAKATLVRKSTSRPKYKYEYQGVPYYSKPYKAVLLFLTDVKAKGEFYFLSFGFQQYRNDEGLIFRQGLAVTGETLGTGSILAQNLVLFDSEISKENIKYIPGLLKVPFNEFCVPVEIAERLAKEYPEVQRLVSEEFKETNKKMPVYVVNENVILESCTSKESQYDRIKALLLLKGEAKIADKNYYVADSKFSGFGKNYLVGEEME